MYPTENFWFFFQPKWYNTVFPISVNRNSFSDFSDTGCWNNSNSFLSLVLYFQLVSKSCQLYFQNISWLWPLLPPPLLLTLWVQMTKIDCVGCWSSLLTHLSAPTLAPLQTVFNTAKWSLKMSCQWHLIWQMSYQSPSNGSLCLTE